MSRTKIIITQLLPALIFFSIININAHAQNKLSREISKEVPAEKASHIRISGIANKLTVQSWPQSKVKIIVQLEYDSSTSRSDEELLENLGISLRSFSNRVDISTGNGGLYNVQLDGKKMPKPSKSATPATPTAPSTAPGVKMMEYADKATKEVWKKVQFEMVEKKRISVETRETLVARHITVFVPSAIQLDIRNKYGDVTVAMDLEKAQFNINNGTLDAQNIEQLELTGKLCHANLNNIDKATIEFENGDLRAREINELDLDSRGATIEYEKGEKLFLRSQNDDIIIDEIEKVEGRKTYGSIRIDKLTGNFDLEGVNCDIKLRDIDPEAKLIKINNKYADIRLPVRSLTNYYVDFNGYYSMVFAPFRKDIPKENPGNAATGNKTDTVAVEIFGHRSMRETSAFQLARQEGGEVAPRRFTSTVGDLKGKHTRFELICNSCTVDFK